MRFNLWATSEDSEGPFVKIICYGSQSEMNDLAISAGISGNVYVLPDGKEPCEP